MRLGTGTGGLSRSLGRVTGQYDAIWKRDAGTSEGFSSFLPTGPRSLMPISALRPSQGTHWEKAATSFLLRK